MARIPDEIIQQIRDRVDLVDLVGRFVTLKKAGRNYKGLCPFHGEKTPSFNVSPDRGGFYCFGCQEGGNAISFLMKIENLSFPEAARALAAEHGIAIPETDSGERGLAERLYEANEVAQAAYRAALAAPGNPALAYLSKRGTDAASIERFGIGFAPDRWDTVAQRLRERKIPAELGERAGILAPRPSGGHYDRLRGRVTFPIRDTRGRILGFGGRALAADQEPKYLNTPESPIFHKREGFYGFPLALDPIRRSECAVVVEGYFDLVALHRAGVENVLATCGTALSAEHARDLRRRTKTVVLLFDGDEAGQRAITRALEVLLPEGLRVRAAALPAGEDPDSYLRSAGAEALRAVVERAAPALERVIARAISQGIATPAQKADAVAALAPLLALIPAPVERAAFEQQLALAVGVEARHVEAAVRAAQRGEDAREAVPIAPRRRDPQERQIEQLLRVLLEHPAQAARIPAAEVESLFAPGPARELIAALVARAGSVSRRDLEPLIEQLDPAVRSLARSLASGDDEAPSEATAGRVLDDTLAALRKRSLKAQRRVVIRRLHEPDSDDDALLAEIQRLRETPRETKPSRIAPRH